MLFFGIFGCTEDENYNNEQITNSEIVKGINVQRLNLNQSDHKTDLQLKLKNIKSESPQYVSASENSANASSNLIEGLEVLEEDVIYIDYGNKHTYTFKTERIEDNGLVENIVLELDEEGDYLAYLVQYNLTEEEKQIIKDGGFVDVNQKIRIHNLDDFNSQDILEYVQYGLVGIYYLPDCVKFYETEEAYVFDFSDCGKEENIEQEPIEAISPGGGFSGGGGGGGGGTPIENTPPPNGNEGGENDNNNQVQEPINTIGGTLTIPSLNDRNKTEVYKNQIQNCTTLTQDQQSWLTEQDNEDFLAKLYVETCVNGNQNFWEAVKEIIIDPSLENKDIECILSNMLESIEEVDNSLFGDMISAFLNGKSSNLVFKYDPNLTPSNNEGNIILGKTESFDNGKTIEITFGPELENKPNITKEATIIHELVHAFMIVDLIDTGLLFWETNGSPSLSTNSLNICENNNYFSENKDEYFAYIICKHIGLVGNKQWMHELFGISAFNLSSYINRVTQFLVDYHDWSSESDEWVSGVHGTFGENYKALVSTYLVMDALQRTQNFNNWWNGSEDLFRDVVDNIIEKGLLPGSTEMFHANQTCD